MENIIKKAIDGGYIQNSIGVSSEGNVVGLYESMKLFFLDPLFWQALGKACGWGNKRTYNQADQLEVESYWKIYALRFHEINLTEGWDKAIVYLEEVIK